MHVRPTPNCYWFSVYNVQFMSLTYLLNATWMGITSFVGLSLVIHVMLNSVCNVEVFEQKFQYIDTEWGFCLNLSRFGKPSVSVFVQHFMIHIGPLLLSIHTFIMLDA